MLSAVFLRFGIEADFLTMGVFGALSTQDIDKAEKFFKLYVEADKFATK
jgi:hypothetical protein